MAKQSGKVIIFDVMEPPVGHPYHKVYLNITLEAIIQSGIEHSKVYWYVSTHMHPCILTPSHAGMVAPLAKQRLGDTSPPTHYTHHQD